jgi:membrane protein DedA with SNARE-associated domain|tara:strand:- start:861 stop:1100 length:240 start_codon:yes stop_codon:yes gene_type:complete
MKLIIEALVVGILTVIVGSMVGYIVGSVLGTDLPLVCKDWNKKNAMEISLFLTGFVLHLLFEVLGGNKWYCKNGVACSK